MKVKGWNEGTQGKTANWQTMRETYQFKYTRQANKILVKLMGVITKCRKRRQSINKTTHKSHRTQAQCLTAWEQGKLGWPSGRAEAGQ